MIIIFHDKDDDDEVEDGNDSYVADYEVDTMMRINSIITIIMIMSLVISMFIILMLVMMMIMVMTIIV